MFASSVMLWGSRKVVELPEWFYELPVSEDCIYGIGISDSGNDFETDAYSQAVFRARVILSFYNHTKCGSLIKHFERYESDNDSDYYVSKVIRLSTFLIPENAVEVEDKVVLPEGVVIVLAKLDESEISNKIQIDFDYDLVLKYFISESGHDDICDVMWVINMDIDAPKYNFWVESKPGLLSKTHYSSKTGDISYPDWFLYSENVNPDFKVDVSTASLEGGKSDLNAAFWRCFASGVSSISNLEDFSYGTKYFRMKEDDDKTNNNELSINDKESFYENSDAVMKLLIDKEYKGFMPVKFDFAGERKKQTLIMNLQLPVEQKSNEVDKYNELYKEFKESEAFRLLDEELKMRDKEEEKERR